jgi:hypothetical protein
MKKLVALLAALLIPAFVVPSVMARDANWDALREQSINQEVQQKKYDAAFRVTEADASKATPTVPSQPQKRPGVGLADTPVR